MTVEEYFAKSKGDWPKKGVKGVESDWMDVGELEIPHGSLWAGDPWNGNREDGCVVKVPKGTYHLSIKGIDFKGHRRTSRCRLILDGAKSAKPGKSAGEASVDVGVIGLVDMDAFEKAVTETFVDEYMTDIQNATEEPGVGIIAMDYGGKGFQMALMPPGLGDGGYDVFPLKSGTKTVGIEVEFLPNGFSIDHEVNRIG